MPSPERSTWHDQRVTTDPKPRETGRHPPLIADVSHAAQQLQTAEDQHRAAAALLADKLQAAHDGGHTWSEIAQAAGLGSAQTARIRAYRARDAEDLAPSLRWRRERGSAPRPSSNSPGLSVTEAARHLKISRQTVYEWIRSGKLHTATDEAGRTRVLLDGE